MAVAPTPAAKRLPRVAMSAAVSPAAAAAATSGNPVCCIDASVLSVGVVGPPCIADANAVGETYSPFKNRLP